MQAWTLILISSTTRLLKKQVEGTWSLVGLPVQVFQLCAIALSQVTHPLSLTNDKPGRWISDQWEEGSNKLCMCSNNNATQTGWRIGRVHRCLQNLPEYNPNLIRHFLWFGIHRGLWPHTRAATKQLKTSSSRAQLAPVSWFSQNVKYKCSKLKLHWQRMTIVWAWEQDNSALNDISRPSLSHFLEGDSWSTCQSTLDSGTDGPGQKCQKAVFVSPQTVPEMFS